VVAGDGEDVGFRASRERVRVRRFGAHDVFVARRVWIDLIAAEDEQRAGLRHLGAERERGRRDRVRNRVRRIPAVAGIRDVVEPEVAVGRLRIVELGLRLARERFDEACIGMAAEDVRDRHLIRRMREDARVVPSHHRPAPWRDALLHCALRNVSDGG
jgi:hypothetical protein